MVNFIQAFAIMLMGICAVFVAGLPMADLVFSKQTSENMDSYKDSKWALAPFMGFGIIVTVLKLTGAIGVPVMYSAWPLFLLSIMAFILYLFKKYKGGSWGDFFPSKQFIVLFIAIIALTGAAYFVSNPVYYRGYSLGDLLTIANLAEIHRTIPIAQFAESSDRYAWIVGMGYFGGLGRISLSVFGAFVATISFVDGASVIGFMSILSVLLVYCSIVFVTKDIKIKPYYRWAACFSGAMLPSVVMNQLEGFMGVSIFTSFIVIFAKLSVDIYDGPDWLKTIAFGFFISAAITTMLDGIYLFIAINLLLLLVFLIGKGSKLKLLIHAIVLTCVTIILNLPFRDAIIGELSLGMDAARTALNHYFPSAYSKDMFNRLIMGSVFENTNEIIIRVISVLSSFIVVGGIYGLIELLVRKRRLEGLAFIPIVFSPLFFYSRPEDYSYAIHKLVQMSIPLIILGIWLFWETCQSKMQTSLLFNGKDKLNKFFSACALKGGTVFLTAIFIYTSSVSVVRTVNVLNPFNPPDDDPLTVTWLGYLAADKSNETRAIYDELRATKDNVDYLFVHDGFEHAVTRWMSYYARGNPVYYLNGDENHRLSVDNLTELPMGVIIRHAQWGFNIVSDTLLHEDFAALMLCNTEEGKVTINESHRYIPTPLANSFQFNIFAREAVPATLWLYPAKDILEKITLSYDGNTYSIDSSGAFMIPLNLQTGGQELTVTAQNGDIAFEQFYLDINLLSPSNK